MNRSQKIIAKMKYWPLLTLAIALLGCNGRTEPNAGPVVQRSTKELIGQINANNALIRTLWSRLDIKVDSPMKNTA